MYTHRHAWNIKETLYNQNLHELKSVTRLHFVRAISRLITISGAETCESFDAQRACHLHPDQCQLHWQARQTQGAKNNLHLTITHKHTHVNSPYDGAPEYIYLVCMSEWAIQRGTVNTLKYSEDILMIAAAKTGKERWLKFRKHVWITFIYCKINGEKKHQQKA